MKSFLIREALDLFQKYTVIELDRFMASQKLIKYVYEEACGCLCAYISCDKLFHCKCYAIVRQGKRM